MSEKYTLNWQKACVGEASSIRDALNAISSSGALMACVVRNDGTLVGILTDSDLRRALLSGATLSEPAASWMNSNPVIASISHSVSDLNRIVGSFNIRELPIVDDHGRLHDIFALGTHDTKVNNTSTPDTQSGKAELITTSCSMMILAGGLGTRLRSVVSDRPKPLALVGKRPILETVISRAASEGVRKFYVSVNYMAEHIEEHLESSLYKDLDITIIRENKRMGTAGSISLIPDQITSPLIVANSDILTTASLSQLLRRHINQKAFITCAVRPYSHKIPFGVCEIKDSKITHITEKPTSTVLVNAGLYILSPEAVRRIPPEKFFDMPELLNDGIKTGETVVPFYLHEYWIDIGKPEDFAKANDEYHLHFDLNND